MEPRDKKISVIVRAYNESQHLGRLLEGLRKQTREPDEIIVVDSGSTDDTVSIAEQHGCKVVHIQKSQFSFGRALNMGCEAAQGDILLIVSAHVYPIYDSYVEHMSSAFERPGVSIAYGRQVGDHRTKFSESRVMLKWFPEQSIWDQGHPFSNNANAAVLRDSWAKLLYDESLTGLEDLDFAKRALAGDAKIAYIADAAVVHVHEETWAIIQNRYRREAIAYAKIMKQKPMSFPTAIWLATKNAFGDYRHAASAGRLRANLFSIPRFRFAQFVGAWQGFREHENISHALLERFYYPPQREQSYSTLHPAGKPIEYTDTLRDLS